MSGAQDDTEKSHEPTEQKLLKAREKGEVARSTDLSVAAAYAGILVAAVAVGAQSLQAMGSVFVVLVDQSHELADLIFRGSPRPLMGGFLWQMAISAAPWFVVPTAVVLLSILAQRALVFAPSKLKPKISRISINSNAKNKFGRSGLFEFFKSFLKLLLYSACLALFIKAHLPEIVGSIAASPRQVVALLAELCVQFMLIALLIASGLGIIDALWQHKEHRRKNMMSRKELTDEAKEAEGDPYIKQQRRMRGQTIAMSQMMAAVPEADVIIVNPTHFAVALQWDRKPTTAPVCVAKGMDEMAASIREKAQECGVPIHSDPPTARALHAVTEVGEEIQAEFFGPVAVAIRFAEDMRRKARERMS